jgi:hypothetical protein
MTDPTTVIRLWRREAEMRKLKLMQSMASGQPRREYLLTCGAIRELDTMLGVMTNLITGKHKETQDGEGSESNDD